MLSLFNNNNHLCYYCIGDLASGPEVDTIIPSAKSKGKAVKRLPVASDKTAKPGISIVCVVLN